MNYKIEGTVGFPQGVTDPLSVFHVQASQDGNLVAETQTDLQSNLRGRARLEE